MKLKTFLLLALMAFGVFACTDLEEDLNGELSENVDQDVNALLQGVYEGLRNPFQNQDQVFALAEHTSDAVIGPTRGPDWDDNGVWRVLHNHQWTPEHQFITFTFNNLLQVVFNTTNLLEFNPTPQQAAEARFVRAFVIFYMADFYGQVPVREAGGNLLEAPPVLTAEEAIDFVVSEIDAIINDLPDGPAFRGNKDAARTLKMKALLNKGAFLNRENPTFDQADLQEVINLAEEITANGYTLAENYFDNFAPDNDVISPELIFTNQNIGGSDGGNVRSRWRMTIHYNQNPSGWNGFTTLADFYNKFEEGDERLGGDYEGTTDVSGLEVGFLVGQQFDESGTPLEDRRGNPLIFTPEIDLTETGEDLETRGIRVVKYPVDFNADGTDDRDPSGNDFVFFRYADVLLMQAEALLRSGDEAGALEIVNQIRTQRGTSELGSLTEDELLDERGRELYWEGHRRQDMIRFGRFLDAYDDKPQSDPSRLLFPIPATALAVNPNLTQNPGY